MDELLRERLSKIRLVMLDVDGVLTDGGLYFAESGEQMKKFHARDGYGIVLLRQNGIAVVFISGLESRLVEARARDLCVNEVIQNCLKKEKAVEDLLERMKLEWDEAAFIGDDLIDVPVMQRVGFAAAVADAVEETKKAAHYVTSLPGGGGAVREVADLIMRSRAEVDTV